jgi:hypothetical protein
MNIWLGAVVIAPLVSSMAILAEIVEGEDICRGGDGLAASLPVFSTINVDVPCQRLLRQLLSCHLTPLPPPVKTSEEARQNI